MTTELSSNEFLFLLQNAELTNVDNHNTGVLKAEEEVGSLEHRSISIFFGEAMGRGFVVIH
jgi:hypothetical protein